MVQQEKDKLLHLHTRHTNLSIPYSDYIGYDKFPEQNKFLLGQHVQIKFYNIHYYNGSSTEYEEDNSGDIFVEKCLVLRCDNTEPYRMIVISLNGRYIFVTDSRKYDTIVTQYPVQLSEYICVTAKTQYPEIQQEFDAVTLRVDEGEPCYSVIMEYIDETKVRFVLGDECLVKMEGYINGEYNGNFSRYLTDNVVASERIRLIEGKDISWY